MARISIAGTATSFICPDGDTILRAGLRAGLGLPHKCNSGACGECRFELTDGQLNEYSQQYPALSDRDIERGRGIACQARPQTDCTISIEFDPSAVPPIQPVLSDCALLSKSDIGPNLVGIRVEAPTRCLPGQYALLRFPEEKVERPFGILAGSETPQAWDFLIRSNGAAASPLGDGGVPQLLVVDGPYGTAFYRPNVRYQTCVAEGDGLAQAVAIARAALADRPCEAITVLVACWPHDEAACKSLFARLGEGDSRLSVHYVSFHADAAEGQRARQVGEALQAVLDSSPDHAGSGTIFYFFGSARVVAGCRRVLSQKCEVSPEMVHFDAYY
jgi:toluene monooxygenase electron transfer component